jgi:hypothetical protein
MAVVICFVKVFKRVLISGKEYDSVITFYNRVFMPSLKTYVLQLGGNRVCCTLNFTLCDYYRDILFLDTLPFSFLQYGKFLAYCIQKLTNECELNRMLVALVIYHCLALLHDITALQVRYSIKYALIDKGYVDSYF